MPVNERYDRPADPLIYALGTLLIVMRFGALRHLVVNDETSRTRVDGAEPRAAGPLPDAGRLHARICRAAASGSWAWKMGRTTTRTAAATRIDWNERSARTCS